MQQGIIYKYLKAKHWQLFLLTFGVPTIFMILNTLLMNFFNISNVHGLFNYKIFGLSIVYILILSYGWYFSIAVGLQKIKLVKSKLNIQKFILMFILQICSFVTVLVLANFLLTDSLNITLSILIVIVSSHLLSIISFFYCLYFLTVTIKTAESQKCETISSCLFEFIMIGLFPIGIWIIQPRINKVVDNQIDK